MWTMIIKFSSTIGDSCIRQDCYDSLLVSKVNTLSNTSSRSRANKFKTYTALQNKDRKDQFTKAIGSEGGPMLQYEMNGRFYPLVCH